MLRIASTVAAAAAACLVVIAPRSAQAQMTTSSSTASTSNFQQINNATALAGTWSSGSGAVKTGIGFFNPISKNFTMPATSGISYSFTEDGHFETSTFTYTSNPQKNRCFQAALTWQHGKFTFNANNSLSLFPFTPDGYVQVMDPCAAQTVQKYSYAQFELIPSWNTYLDAHPGFQASGSAWALQMYENGGSGQAGAPYNVMWLTNRPPVMLPTEQLYEEVLNAVGASQGS